MGTRPFQSIAAKSRTTWSPSAKDLANRLSAHLEAEWCREDSLEEFDQHIEQVRRAAKIEALEEAAELARSLWTGTTVLPSLDEPEDTSYSFDAWLGHLATRLKQE